MWPFDRRPAARPGYKGDIFKPGDLAMCLTDDLQPGPTFKPRKDQVYMVAEVSTCCELVCTHMVRFPGMPSEAFYLAQHFRKVVSGGPESKVERSIKRPKLVGV